jgi:hypothetical protein
MKSFLFLLSLVAFAVADEELSEFISGSKQFTGTIYNVSLFRIFGTMLITGFSNSWSTTMTTSWSVLSQQKRSWL